MIHCSSFNDIGRHMFVFQPTQPDRVTANRQPYSEFVAVCLVRLTMLACKYGKITIILK